MEGVYIWHEVSLSVDAAWVKLGQDINRGSESLQQYTLEVGKISNFSYKLFQMYVYLSYSPTLAG